jgi:hypothetical protein
MQIGWVIIGDSSMHLKRILELSGAFGISGLINDWRSKDACCKFIMIPIA